MHYHEHYSVLKNECIEFLKTAVSERGDGLFCDLTFGYGGHTIELLCECPKINMIVFDQDPDAYQAGMKRLDDLHLSARVKFINKNFSSYKDEMSEKFGNVSGVLMDLGVSSHHFDENSRGFSFKGDAPLDMRMDTNAEFSAKDIVNSYSEEELADIFFKYGEERYSRKIAKKIVEKRAEAEITRTSELENIIFHCYPPKGRHGKTNPSTRCFQALRIEVNQELRVLEETLPDIYESLMPGGILAVISFHSLEDRIVKHSFRALAESRKDILTKKPIVPSEKELQENSRSRSAKLRVIRKPLL